MSPGLSSCQGCQALSSAVKGTIKPLSRPLSRSTVNTVKPLSGHCQVILTVTTRVCCQDCQAGLCQAVRAVSHCHGMPTPAGRGPRRVLGGQDGSMWVGAGSQEGWACEGSMVVVLRGGPGSRFAYQTVRLSDCQGLDSLDSTCAWSLSRSLDRALTLCQGSVKPLSIDIAVKPVKTVKLSVDTLSDCQARAQSLPR